MLLVVIEDSAGSSALEEVNTIEIWCGQILHVLSSCEGSYVARNEEKQEACEERIRLESPLQEVRIIPFYLGEEILCYRTFKY